MSIDSAVMIRYIYMNFFVTMHAQTFEEYKYYYVDMNQHFWL